MSAVTDELLAKIKQLSDEEQLRLIDAVLTNLGASEPQITRVWADEARKRWTAYKAGEIPTASYEGNGEAQTMIDYENPLPHDCGD